MGISFRDDFLTMNDLNPSSRPVMVRARLRALANQVASGGVVSVVAGPGYGKTSFLMDMLSTSSGPRAYFALAEKDQPPIHVLACLAQSLGLGPSGFPDVDQCDRSPCGGLNQASLAIVQRVSSYMYERCGESGLVAIDDLHNGVAGLGLAEALLLVAAALPPRWRLLVASRQPVFFDRLRLGGRLVEIQGAQLRFTPNEIRAWFAETRDVHLDLSDAKSVWRATQGWPAALAMLGTSLLSRLSLRPGLMTPVDDPRVFSEYLDRCVLRALSPRESEIVTAAALLPRVLFPRDNDFLPGDPGEAESVFESLSSRGFLVHRTGHRAFAIHPLVAEHVKQQMSQLGPRSREIERATAHLETTGELRAAVPLLLRSRNLEDASRLIRLMVIQSHLPGLPDATDEWLTGLSLEAQSDSAAYPWLGVVEAAIYQNRGDYRRSSDLYQTPAETILKKGDRQGGLLVLLGQALSLAGQSRHQEALAIVERCRPLVDSTRQRVELLVTEAVQLGQLCRCESSTARLDEAIALAPLGSSWSPTTRLRAGANKSVIFHRLGCYERGRIEIEKVLTLANSRTSFLFALVLNNAATMNAHTGGYAQARRQLNEAERLMWSHCYAFIRCPVLLNRIMMFEAEGDIREALRVAKVARTAASEEGHRGDEYWALQLHGDLWRRAKNPVRALECHRAALALVEDGVMGQFGRTLAKTHVAMDLVLLGREAEAEEMLRDCVRFGRSGEFYGILMPALFYLGWLHARAGRRTEAVQCLTRSLKIADVGGQVDMSFHVHRDV